MSGISLLFIFCERRQVLSDITSLQNEAERRKNELTSLQQEEKQHKCIMSGSVLSSLHEVVFT